MSAYYAEASREMQPYEGEPKMKTGTVSAAVVAALILCGCATVPQNVNPHVTILGADHKQVTSVIVQKAAESGMSVLSATDYSVTMERQINDSFWTSLLYGSQFNIYPNARLTYTIVDQPNGDVVVFLRGMLIRNPGSAIEVATDFTQYEAPRMQAQLDSLKRQVELRKARQEIAQMPAKKPRAVNDQRAVARPIRTSSEEYGTVTYGSGIVSRVR